MARFVPDDATLTQLLEGSKTIAVVGLSDDPSRPSNDVAAYLRDHGYQIVPVNPKLEELWGVKAYPDLGAVRDAGIDIDVVDVFRRPEHAEPVADEAIKVGAKAIWFQEGVVNETAARKAQEAGLEVVMDRCMKKEHGRLVR